MDGLNHPKKQCIIKKQIKIMRNALLNGFFPVKPVTTAFDEMFGNLNQIVRDPFFDDVENFFHQPVLGYHAEKTDKGYVVEMPVPGFTKKDVTVTTNDRTLVISLEGTSEKKWVNKTERTFTLPKEIDTEGVTAKVKDGILTVNLPVCTKTEKSVPVE